VHRLKAKLLLDNGQVKIVQGVREIFEILDTPEHEPEVINGGSKEGKIVVIGRNLSSSKFNESLTAVLLQER
jgi:hypothetical protein